jgi:hypothetical protein
MAATLLRGAHELQLSEDEKAAVSRVEAALVADESDGGLSSASSRFMRDLAIGVHQGKLDPAKLAADYAAIDQASAAQQAREAAAIVGLHDALPTAQRQTLSGALREKRARHERMIQARSPDSGGPDVVKMRVDQLTRDLALDVDGGQRAKVETIVAGDVKSDPQGPDLVLARRDENNKRIDAILAAFDSSALDAGALLLGTAAPRSPHEGPERTAAFYAQLIPLLKPDQREKLADRLRTISERPGRFTGDNPLGAGLEAPDETPMAPAPR